jgi:hypothetical protein
MPKRLLCLTLIAAGGIALACEEPAVAAGTTGDATTCLARSKIISPAVVYGEQTKVSGRDGATLDFRGKPVVANSPRYPVSLYDAADGTCITGLKVTGRQPTTMTWEQMKSTWDGDSVLVKYATGQNFTIERSYFKNTEDGLTPRATTATSKWVVRGVYMAGIRDDAIENDQCLAGEIIDTLIDGTHMFLSTRPGKANGDSTCARKNTVTVRNSLIRLACQADSRDDRSCGPGTSHGQLFKWSSTAGTVDIRDTIFLIPTMSRNGRSSMRFPPGTYSNVTLIWLGQGDYPQALPPGVRLTRDVTIWNAARAAWLSNHGCTLDAQYCSFLQR